jgi:hypothetical protein
MDPNHDIVPTLRMFDGLLMTQAADEIDRLRAQLQTPNASLPPLGGDGPRREILVRVSVPENWESSLDMQWVLEREIHADRWSWSWPPNEGSEEMFKPDWVNYEQGRKDGLAEASFIQTTPTAMTNGATESDK